MIYKVIGLMSGSSLDGLDIAYVHLEEMRGRWNFELIQAECIPYTATWRHDLKEAADKRVPEFLQLHTSYGHFLGAEVRTFMTRNNLDHQVDFIASHGHTVFHDPAFQTTCQIGDGAAIAAETGLPVISDLRSLDIALGGQGAPIVPAGDRLLFGDYDYWLNLGGIANVTMKQDELFLAFDVCPCNQVLDALAQKKGKSYDAGGAIAAQGHIWPVVLDALNELDYYKHAPPKSLGNDFSINHILPLLQSMSGSVEDQLRTYVTHIAGQIAAAVPRFLIGRETRMLATGGGALNTFLIQTLQQQLADASISVIVPEESIVQYKEAIVMALLGALRWREEVNVLSSVTGAKRDSIGGAVWMGGD